MTWLLWAVLAVLGEVAMLLLTHAGNTVGYQHFTPLALRGIAPSIAQLVLGIQMFAVAAACVRRWPSIRAGLARVAPGWRLAALLVCFVLGSATLSRDPSAYALELVLASLVQATQLATLALLVASLPASGKEDWRRRIERLLGPPSDAIEPGWDRLAIGLGLWTAAVAFLLAVLSYQRMPHIPDEVVYLLHARYFADGLLTMPAPPVPGAFDLDLMNYEPARWFSPVPPGWPAILAVGVKLGAPWLVNPLLAGLNVVLASLLLREIYPRRTARLVILLLAASPWAILMAMNLTTHTASLAAALLAALAVARLRRGSSLGWALLGGAMIGGVSLIRPLEGFAVALLLGLWSLPARWRGLPLVPSALLTLSTIAAGALNFPYNRALTGKPTYFPIMAYADKVYGPGTNAMGFGPNRGLGWSGLDPYPGHGWRDVLVNTDLNVFQVNIELLGWGFGSLLAVWLLATTFRLRRADWWMVSVVVMIAGLHAFYWFSGGPDFGARYWYLILLPMLALVTRGIEESDRSLAGAMTTGPASGVAALATLLALLAFVPWRGIDKYWHYRGMRPDVREMARAHDFGRSLVLIRGNRHPDYHGAATFNPVDLQAAVPVYAWDRGAATRDSLYAAYPDRSVWVIDGPTLTRGGYHIVAGPLSVAQARAQLP